MFYYTQTIPLVVILARITKVEKALAQNTRNVEAVKIIVLTSRSIITINHLHNNREYMSTILEYATLRKQNDGIRLTLSLLTATICRPLITLYTSLTHSHIRIDRTRQNFGLLTK